MSDYLSSVLDELVPTFEDEDGNWGRVVADAGVETPAATAQPRPLGPVASSAAPRRRHGPSRGGGSAVVGSSPSPSPLS